MKPLKLYNSTSADTTTIPNLFIDHFMKEANDAQIKVYLFLLRALYTNCDISIAHIADQFNHTEKDVIRALEYWNLKQLISLEYGTNHEISGIALRDMPSIAPTATDTSHHCITLFPPTAVSTPVAEPTPASPLPSSDATSKTPQKPNYTMKELQKHTQNESLQQLIFITESYLGKTLAPTDIHSLIFYVSELKLSIDLIDYLLQYCVEKGKTNFRYIDKVAMNWAEEGIKTPEDAMSCTLKYDADTYAIMNALGKSSKITDTELSYITRWKTYFCFPMEIIQAACATTVLNVDKRRFIYANSILENWFKQGVRSLDDIKKLDEKFKSNKVVSTVNRKTNVAATNKFNNYKQNSYDYNSLEQNLLQQ